MTWGAKTATRAIAHFFPPVCTYAGMDSMLQLRYTNMADSNNALISPVSQVWKQLRKTNPAFELYDPDESHPSLRGSFAAACCFYAIIFKKDPVLAPFRLFGDTAGSSLIKRTARDVVFNQLQKWSAFQAVPEALFSHTITGDSLKCTNLSANADSYTWYFGDGDSSFQQNPVHPIPAVAHIH